MSDYNQIRTASGEIVSRFAVMLKNLDDGVEQISHWHYQLMDHKDGTYGIHEYYPMSGRDGWTNEPISIYGDSIGEIVWMLKTILSDIEKHGVKDYDAKP
jgi:hypothetical protein